MKAEQIGTTINQVTDLLNTALGFKKGAVGKYAPMEGTIKRIVALAERINPQYPTESVDLLDMVMIACRHEHVPTVDTIDTIEGKLKAADFTGGKLKWRFKPNELRVSFYPKKSAGRYDIYFIGESGPTTFPFTVKVDEWSDLDDLANHSDECPQLFDEDDPEYSNECNCEPEIIRTEARTFAEPDEFFADFEKWLLAAHWGNMDNYVSAYATHKITFVVADGRKTAADCSCGKWSASSTTDTPERELINLWREHVKNA